MLPEYYNSLFTMHATIMIFFAIMPILIGAFGNFVVPIQIGARDMAFPKLNMMSFWVAVPAAVVIIWSFFVTGGAAAGGWTSYAPLSAIQPRGQTLWLIALLILGLSSLLTAVNFLTTIINMRAPGMGFFRLPLTTWALFITAMLLLLALPVLSGGAHHAALRPHARHDVLPAGRPHRLRSAAGRTRAAGRCSSGSTCSGSSGTPRSTS